MLVMGATLFLDKLFGPKHMYMLCELPAARLIKMYELPGHKTTLMALGWHHCIF